MTILDIAKNYIAEGWSPTPIPFKEKRPRRDDWEKDRITSEQAPLYFNGSPQNIGVILGEASHGLTDVDLDCDEAVAAAGYFLPSTRCFGRPGKRTSHWLYYTDLSKTQDKATIPFKEGSTMLLECRVGAAGAQTVFPGSTHPSGEVIAWEGATSAPIKSLPGADLVSLCKRIAFVAQVARRYPQVGGRHDAALAIGGLLARSGVNAGDAEQIAQAICEASNQDTDKAEDIVRAVLATIDDFAKGKSGIYGYPRFAAVFGDDAARKCAEWLGFRGSKLEDDTPQSTADATPVNLDGAYYSFPTAASIEPREFLYGGHYLREYVSVTIAPTKVGKSSLGIVEALAMASGKPLLGVQPEGVFRVRIWNGEDPQREMDRRILAAMLEYGLTREDVGDRLLVNSGRDQPIIMATQMRTGTIIHAPVMNEIIASIRRQKIDCFIVDPIIKIHNVSENDNVAIDAVVREWNRVAGETRIALDLVHHSRKMNGGEASLDDARGASALVSAARAARVLARMTKREADRIANIKNFKRLFRFADAASNMVAPGDEDDIWMEIKSVDLRNARFDATGKQLVKSDRVGVVKVFNLGGIVSDPQDDREARCFAEIAAGDWRRDSRTRDSWVGHLIGRIYDLDTDDEEGKSAIKATVSRWIREKKIREIKRPDQHRNKHMFLEVRDGQTVKPDLFG